MNPPELRIETRPWQQLDHIGLQHNQDPRVKDKDAWFGVFREGIWGLQARLQSVQQDFEALYAWNGIRHSILCDEQHISSLLYGMASALEVAVYALNALGHPFIPGGFRDISEAKSKPVVTCRDVLNLKDGIGRTGYASGFPQFQDRWRQYDVLIETILENHKVAKHRGMAYSRNGQKNICPPPGFIDKHGLSPDRPGELLDHSPWFEIRLISLPQPSAMVPSLPDPPMYQTLESVAISFAGLILQSGEAAVSDATRVLPTKLPPNGDQTGVAGRLTRRQIGIKEICHEEDCNPLAD